MTKKPGNPLPFQIRSLRSAVGKALRNNPQANLTELSGLMGIPVADLKRALEPISKYAHIVAHGRNPGPPPKLGFGTRKTKYDRKTVPNNVQKPLFVREFEEHTGMDCSYIRRTGDFTEWAVVSPKGIILVTLLGVSDTIQHISTPKPWQVQGLRYSDYTQRRSLRAKKILNAESATIQELDDQPD